MGWFVPSALVVMYLNAATVVVGALLAGLTFKKWLKTRQKVALFLFLHLLLFLIGFTVSLLTLLVEYGHDFWGWQVPYVRRYSIAIAYGIDAAGILFLVLFADAVFRMNPLLKKLLLVYGVVAIPVMIHPANHWEIIKMEEYDFDLRVISAPMFVFYMFIVSLVIAHGAFKAAKMASERKFEVGLRLIGSGAVATLLAVIFVLVDTYLFTVYHWDYNVASWLTWIFIMSASVLFYLGYALPRFIAKRLER